MPLNGKLSRVWLVLMVSLGLGVVMVSSLQTPVHAQSDPTPPAQVAEGAPHGEMDGPLPGRIEGDAVWTVGNLQYTGEFPNGFRFEIAASSDQGPITSARVVWVHAPGTNTRRSASAHLDDQNGQWVAVWEPGTSQVPPWVLVRYHWELADDKGNRYIGPEIDEVYADVANADQWGHLESEDVVVYWIGLSESYGQKTIEAMAARREFYRQAWGGLLPYRPRVVLYGWAARDEYQMLFNRPVFVGGSYVAGTTSGDWGGTVQLAGPGSAPEDSAYGTVLHEVAHLYQNQFARVTVDWFIEGDAEFFSLARATDYRTWGRSRLLSGDPLSFAAGFSTDGTGFRDGYWLSTTVWDYLVETYGLDAHRQVWDLIANNVPRFEAIERVTGVSIQQFEQNWRSWLGVDSPPPTVVPSPTPRFDIFSIPTPTFLAPGG